MFEKDLAFIIVLVVMIIFIPLGLIWALNTLFGLTIAYTFKTWCAALILGSTVKSTSTKSN